MKGSDHEHPAAPLRLAPRRRLRVARDRGDLPRRLPRHPPRRRDPRVGPLGRHAARVRTRRGGREDGRVRRRRPAGRRGPGVARGDRHVPPLRRRRPLPVQRPHVERGRALHPQAVHRRHLPARPRLRLRPGARLHRPAAGQEGGGDLHERRLRPGARPRLRCRLPAPVPRRLAALDGHRRPHRASSSGPTSRRRTPTPAAARPTPPPGTRARCSERAVHARRRPAACGKPVRRNGRGAVRSGTGTPCCPAPRAGSSAGSPSSAPTAARSPPGC